MTRLSFSFAALLAAPFAFGQQKPLDHSVYDGWKSIPTAILSRDGKYVAYAVNPQEGDGVVTVRRNADGATLDIPRGAGLRFTRDSRFLIATQSVPFLEARQARRDKKKPEDTPKPSLVVVDLGAMKAETAERITSWNLAQEDKGWLAYRVEPPKADPAKKEETAKTDPKAEKPKKKTDHKKGDPLTLWKLGTATRTVVPDVAAFGFSKDGGTIALSLSTADGGGDGVVRHRLGATAPSAAEALASGLGRYTKLAVSASGDRVAYVTDRDDYVAKKPAVKLFVNKEEVAAPTNPGGWIVNENTAPRFSDSGRRLFFGVGPKVVEEKETPDDEKVSLDVWNWKDPLLQPQQLLQQKAERERTYDVLHENGRSVLLEDAAVTSVTVPGKGDGPVGYAVEDIPYGQLVSWDGDFGDLYRVDLASGARIRVFEKIRGPVSASPDGRTLAVFDEERAKLFTVDLASGDKKEVVTGTKLFDELDDHPDFAGAYPIAGWTSDGALLVQDRFDVFSVKSGRVTRLTEGRPYGIVYRTVSVRDDEDGLNTGDLYLTSFNERTKDMGLFRLKGGSRVAEIAPQPKMFLAPILAEESETMLYRRSDVREFPDLWLTDASFRKPKKITEVGKQTESYVWPTAELVEWTSNDGVKLQGILYKPDDFDRGKKYPMISYFYERSSDALHRHLSPAPSASTINIPLFVSQGYLVFVPDVVYKVGYPGESAMSCIVSGVNKLVDTRSYIDPKRLGIQGQSWGGYQVAYMVTETDMFAAGGAGAPVSNMTSAYGGIRYGSGLVRQFQYERQQSRIGGTPWNGLQRYIENSPLFFADKVKTPLLIMANDKDGAVPYTQGIEFFTALRRLQKPVWMLVYNEEDHNLVQRKNRKDLSLRLSGFFDHFLKGTPAPVWLESGLPAKDKGRTMGTEVISSKKGTP